MRQRLTMIISRYKPQAREALKHNLLPHWLPRAASQKTPGILQGAPRLGAWPWCAGFGTVMSGLQGPSPMKSAVQVDGSSVFLMGQVLSSSTAWKGREEFIW